MMSLIEEVVGRLGLHQAIEGKIDFLYDRLKEGHEEGGGVPVAVMNNVLPAVSVFINYASTRAKLLDALGLLKERLGVEARDEAMATLALFTLKHIVQVGLSKHADDPEKVTTWHEIEEDLVAGAQALAYDPVPAGQQEPAEVR